MSNKKKILAVFGNVALFGKERANIHVFETLSNEGFEILLTVNDRGFDWFLKPEIENRNLNYKKIRFPWGFRKKAGIKHFFQNIFDFILLNFQFFKIYKEFSPDYIHVCDDRQVIFLIPSFLILNTPIVYRLGDKPASHFRFHSFLWSKIITRVITKFVCISHFIEKELLKLNSEVQNTEVIYNTPPARSYSIPEISPLKNKKKVRFIYIGQISKSKGVDILVDAFIELSLRYPDIELFLAGDTTDNELAKELLDTVTRKDLESYIKFLGNVNDIDALLRTGDLGIFPSVAAEALSNVIGEAKKNSIASIIFASGGMPELVEHGKTGFITNSKDVSGLIEAVEFYLANPQLIKEHGKNAFNSIAELGLDSQSFKNKWLNVYSN